MAKLLTNAAKWACEKCLEEITRHEKLCPWRSIDNDYCDEARNLDRAAMAMVSKVKRRIVEMENESSEQSE